MAISGPMERTFTITPTAWSLPPFSTKRRPNGQRTCSTQPPQFKPWRTPMTTEPTNPFETALAAATGDRTAADAAASNQHMDDQLRAFEARIAAGDYAAAPLVL